MLFLIWLLLGVVMTSMAVGLRGVDVLGKVGLAAGAVSSYLLVWWSGRYWYAAFCDGRRGEAVEEPDPWPWCLPGVLIGVTLAVAGVRALNQGDGSGWFSLGFAGLLGLPSLLGLVVGVGMRRVAQVPVAPPAEPPRPRRDWGPIGR
ncbi:hypothetical protein [Streptomyces sp. P17]|uniref:hypothetical protein n=1 Tax=Streptomyces sp. P17 TaxID=3074716 RepID=UPI0028F46088|nr:hypothetical protein [Streptomyces sp. P17]MDT9700816.1 hypothetical protein [Streptomyces sp. P17]